MSAPNRINLHVSKMRIGVRVKVQTPNPNQPGVLMTLGKLQMNSDMFAAFAWALKVGGDRKEPPLLVTRSGADDLRAWPDRSAR